MRFNRPSRLLPVPRYSVKAPPAVATPSAFVPVVGPDESSLPAASIASDRTTFSGPVTVKQPRASALNACKLPPGWISHDTLASPPSTTAFKAPPPSVMATSSKHPPPKVPAHPLVSRPDIPRTVPGILPATAGFTAKAKPPPTTIPIGRARPEGQPPPYPKAKPVAVKQPPPIPCSDAISFVIRGEVHKLQPVTRDPVGPPT